MMILSTLTPSDQLLKAARASLILRGSSLSDWSRKNGCKRQNLTTALNGKWSGPAARALVCRFIDDVEGEE